MSKENIMNTYGRFPINLERGIGTKVYTVEGTEYLDFVSGVAANCLGHSHPALAKAISEQSQKLMHVSNIYWNVNQIKLAEKLTKYSDHDRVFFCNSGTEAIETALKLARKYGKVNGNENKNEIIFMENSFHGRTLGALAVTGQSKYQKDFTPLMNGIKSSKFNDIKDIEAKVNENTCAVILEPVQGEGGILPAEEEFLKKVRELCDKYDALLIFDEVQTGVGRLGTLFGYQSYGVIPDVVCSSKGLGGGFPIGAAIATEKAASAFVPGDHGCTFGGNPLACSASLAVLEELIDNGIIKEVDEKSKYIIDKINILKEKYEAIDGVQGKGLLLGLRVNIDPKVIINKCFEKNMLLIGAGKNIIRILPPLNVTTEEIDKALSILEEALEEVSKDK